MSLATRVSDDVFVHLPEKSKQDASAEDIRLIFYIPGNPGLISYYHEFLAMLAASEEGKHYAIVGMSLAGFETEGKELDWNDEDLLFPDTVAAKRSAKRRGEEQFWWSLEEQVDLTLARIDEVVRRLGRGRKVKVTLTGHSLGTFMSLEVVRKVNEGNEQNNEPNVDSSGVLGIGQHAGNAATWQIEACVCLAPTIMDLAKSPSGVVASPILSTIGFLPRLVQFIAGLLTWAFNIQTIQWLVARHLGLSPENPGVASTARFLKSERGVRQSLELAKQEMISIARDDWGPEIWGCGPALQMGGLDQTRGPKLFFLFAQKDHWIANETRDGILRTRPRLDGHGEFIVDQKHGLTHAWCLEQNSAVADYVKPWLRDISNGS